MVICLEQGADLHMAQLMPLPLIVSCFSKIHIGFTFLVPAHLGSPGKRAIKRVCVCVLPCCKKMEKNRPFVGPPFCGAPVRPNMLNMPKSASGTSKTVLCTPTQWRSQKFLTICSIPFCAFPISCPTKSAVQLKNVMTYHTA